MDTELAAELRGAVVRFSRRLRRERPEYALLSMSHLSALASLYKAGALSPRELASVERVQPPSMTRIVVRLQELELVERSPHPTDRRQAVLALTPKGRDLVAENRRRREAWLARRLDDLAPDERETLRKAAALLERLGGE
ncbi:MAG TPA: MarR family transcriptional regulator [Mycobacteriales bacterium]|jgi:DNA-binding MarR family transcriptional regulator